VPPLVTELLQEHVVAAMIKQARLRDSVDESAQGWSVDVAEGRLELGSRVFGAELIGLEQGDGAFHWGWEDPGFGDEIVGRALALRDLGLPTEQLDAFTAAVITVGVAGLDAYYLAPYEEGGVLVLGIRDDNLRVGPPAASVLASTLTNLLADAPSFDHRRAFAHYLARPLPAVRAQVDGGSVVLHAADGDVTVRFGGDGRVAAIDGPSAL
jgi:hypothetical protein